MSAFLSKITVSLSRLTSRTMSASVSKELLNAALLSIAQNGKTTKTVKTKARNTEINLFNAKSPLKSSLKACKIEKYRYKVYQSFATETRGSEKFDLCNGGYPR